MPRKTLTIGTFNLKNLFSRYNFEGEIDAIRSKATQVDGRFQYVFRRRERYKIRSYRGNLVGAKDETDLRRITERIRRLSIDVLAVQVVEDLDTLRRFNRERLDGMYPHGVLVEGNDVRLIDVGMLSKLPIGGVTSWQRAVHPDDPGNLVFGRDLLEVDVLDPRRRRRLFKLFNTHLKSHYLGAGEDPVSGTARANLRRRRQAEMVAKIVKRRTRPDSRFVIVGDMNDPPESEALAGFVEDRELRLVNGLAEASETRPAKRDDPDPSGPVWSYRYKVAGQPAEHYLYDQIWLSPRMAVRQTGAWIDRRRRHRGDGSDHDLVWVVARR